MPAVAFCAARSPLPRHHSARPGRWRKASFQLSARAAASAGRPARRISCSFAMAIRRSILPPVPAHFVVNAHVFVPRPPCAGRTTTVRRGSPGRCARTSATLAWRPAALSAVSVGNTVKRMPSTSHRASAAPPYRPSTATCAPVAAPASPPVRHTQSTAADRLRCCFIP